MKLDKLILVNWGQLRPGNFEMGDMTLLTGETGSGKSTLLDALQTIMTASYKGILNYNPGQDEVSQGQRRGKTKRTLESYIVGAEYNKFSRKDGAQGFMAAVFRPDKGEEHLQPFTALVAAAARVEGSTDSRQAKLESLALIIVDEAALTFEDFMKDVDNNECITVDKIARHLEKKYARVQNFYDKKMDYLCALYGRFRGKNSVTRDEASNAAKAWVQSIAYKPIGSVHELVRDEILEFDEKQLQQDIERISGLMRQVSHLKHESIRLQTNITRLNKLQTIVANSNEAHESYHIQGMVVAQLQLKNTRRAIALKQKQITNTTTTVTEETAKINSSNALIETLDTQRIHLSARLQGIPVHHKKQELDAHLEKANDNAKIALNALRTALMAAGLVEQNARTLCATAIPNECNTLKEAIERVAVDYQSIDFSQLADCHEKVIGALHDEQLDVTALSQLIEAFNYLQPKLEALYGTLLGSETSVALSAATTTPYIAQLKQRADEAVRDLMRQKTQLAQGKISYPRSTQSALDSINEQLPQANAQVLCDLVEPQSEKWQQAIEGYLANARFNLVVHPDFERACVDFLKTKNLSVKIIQGALCLEHAAGKTLPPDSIVHELKAANPIAWAYLVEQYGGVRKVADSEALRHTPRGLTAQGIASASRTMFTCEKTEAVFGLKAREIALVRITHELEKAQTDALALEAAKAYLDQTKALLHGLKPVQFDTTPLQEAANLITKTRTTLSHLDISELKEVEDKFASVNTEIKQKMAEVQISQRRLGALEETIKNAQTAIKELENQAQAYERGCVDQDDKLKQLVTINPQLSYAALTAEVSTRLTDKDLDLETAKNTLDSLATTPDHLLVDAREALLEYNNQAKSDERFTVALLQQHDAVSAEANYAALITLGQDVSKALDGLRSVGLYNNRLELGKAEKSFHDVFTKQFCVAINSRVDEGMRTLRQMNSELKNLKFGNDSFSIDWSRWEPEFEEYLRFFEAVTLMADATEPMDLLGSTELSEKHRQIRDRLVALLLDNDQERATKDLLRIADYRNYRRYDIINNTSNGGRVKLSEWGTGSGGQLETPAYIVRAAVVTNRLKLFDKGPSLKLLVNDESFSKMDEPRARAVLSFLRDKLDLQIISAMPTMKAGALKDEFNREYSFTRLSPVENGELDFLSECDERVFKVDKMRALWAHQRQLARETAKQLFDMSNPLDIDTEINLADTNSITLHPLANDSNKLLVAGEP